MRANWIIAILFIVVLFAVGRALPAPPASQSNPEPDAPLADHDDGSTAPPGALSPDAQDWIKHQDDWPTEPDGKRELSIIEDGYEWDGDLAALHKMPRVNSLRIARGFSENGFENLRGLSNIQSLVFEQEAGVSNRVLSDVATMPNLRELEIDEGGLPGYEDRYVDDKGLVTLSRIPRLTELSLYGPSITEGGLSTLKRFPKLRVFRISSPKLNWDTLSRFPKLEKLEVLEFGANPREGENDFDEMDCEPPVPKGSRVPRSQHQVSPTDRAEPLSAKARSWIAEYKKWPVDADGKWLLEIKESDKLSDSDLAALWQMPEVNRVRIYHEFSAAGATRLRGLKSVEYLTLGPNVEVTDDVLRAVAQMTNLVELQVVQNVAPGGDARRIDDAGLAALSKLPKLKALTIRGAKITEASLTQLTDFPELRLLRLGKTKLTWQCLERFPKLPHLQMFELSCAPLGAGAVK